MGNHIQQIDDYILKAQGFAQPILQHLRTLIHQACPQLEEKVRWGMPHFDYKGMMVSMAAFKAHCSLMFFKGEFLNDPKGVLDKQREKGMGQFGRITSLNDLPSDKVLIEFIKQAMHLNEDGVKKAKPLKKSTPVVVPDVIRTALSSHQKALKYFNSLPPSHQKEYIEWITEAKTDTTREKRIKTMLEWLTEGKSRNWKYMK
ncbi:MAG: YdeI/OmpD-associated family protein [Flavobacteriales bacterium]|nr:YdeI/OmpD-associated family protein [Flavobacteriales bacterium]